MLSQRASPSHHLNRVLLSQLHPHPRNSNQMSPGRLRKLVDNIRSAGAYPPLVVRPHPHINGEFEIIDGHQRWEALRRLGHAEAVCFIWPCDDATALRLLATLNTLRGTENRARRGALMQELMTVLPAEAVAKLLPDSAAGIAKMIGAGAESGAGLGERLQEITARGGRKGPRLLSFALPPADAEVVEKALTRAATGRPEGSTGRGAALTIVARRYLEPGE
jgi:ParB/RepB/Spo0J family partition protein